MSAFASIDIGTNTMLLLIGKTSDSKATSKNAEKPDKSLSGFSFSARLIETILYDCIDFVRLGEGVHQNRVFSEAAMARAMVCFEKYKALCEKYDTKEIIAVATSASRDSTNAEAFYRIVHEKTGIQVRVISGESEAKLSFLGGLLPGQNPNEHVVLDIGGGSTEFVGWDSTHQKVFGQSINMGCVRAKELFLKDDHYSTAKLNQLESALMKEWSTIDPQLKELLKTKTWLGIAGTPTTLAGVALGLKSFDGPKVDGYCLELSALEKLYQKLATQSLSEREANPIIGKGRADIIIPGVAILKTAMQTFGKTEIVVSSRGLRHGVLFYPEFAV